MKELINQGLSVIPIRQDKTPMINGWQNSKLTLEELESHSAYGFGLVCGNGIEVIDIDTKYDLTKTLAKDYFQSIKANDSELIDKLVINKTHSGGYHVVYRCVVIEGNQKLAMRGTTEEEKKENPHNNWMVLIETRGSGGYIVIPPTPKYETKHGSMDSIHEISEEQRNLLFSLARVFNEKIELPPRPKAIEEQYMDGNPFYEYDNKSDFLGYIQGKGWKETGRANGRVLLQRDGSKNRCGATWHESNRLFYVFTTSTDFEANKGYRPATVFTHYEARGDFGESARRLINLGYGKPLEEQKEIKKKSDLMIKLLSQEIRLEKRPDKPPVILSILDGQTDIGVLTLGNISTIMGKAKSKKTFLLSMFDAAMLANGRMMGKFHGDLKGKSIVHFDTEQAPYHAHRVNWRVSQMAGYNVQPTHFKYFCLRPLSPKDRLMAIEEYLYSDGVNPGFVIIDGVRDLMLNFNDVEESTEIASKLLKWTEELNCHICNVIHMNKGDFNARGHMGTELMNKSESVITVDTPVEQKSKAVVSNDFSRGIPFDEFAFDVSTGLPELCEFKIEKKKNEEAPF